MPNKNFPEEPFIFADSPRAQSTMEKTARSVSPLATLRAESDQK